MACRQTELYPAYAGSKARRGSMAVLCAVLLIPIMAFAAFSVDLGFISMVKSQLQNAADSAAMAGVAVLANTNNDEEGREAQARLWAREFAERNQPAHGNVLVNADIILGRWSTTTGTFSVIQGGEKPNAVRVFTRRSQAEGNPVPLFFGTVLGFDDVDMTAESIAKTGEDDPRDIILVLDCSGSMGQNNRMTYTKAAAYALADELLTTDRLGLVIYSYPQDGNETGHLERVMRLNHAPVLDRIPQLSPGMYAPWTNIAGGMRVAIDEFDANRRSLSPESVAKVMVLMTDGQANRSEAPGTTPTNSIQHYAQVALSKNIEIHSVTLGSGADQQHVREAAELTGGSYHHVGDGDFQALIEAFRKIGNGSGIVRIVQ